MKRMMYFKLFSWMLKGVCDLHFDRQCLIFLTKYYTYLQVLMCTDVQGVADPRQQLGLVPGTASCKLLFFQLHAKCTRRLRDLPGGHTEPGGRVTVSLR